MVSILWFHKIYTMMCSRYVMYSDERLDLNVLHLCMCVWWGPFLNQAIFRITPSKLHFCAKPKCKKTETWNILWNLVVSYKHLLHVYINVTYNFCVSVEWVVIYLKYSSLQYAIATWYYAYFEELSMGFSNFKYI